MAFPGKLMTLSQRPRRRSLELGNLTAVRETRRCWRPWSNIHPASRCRHRLPGTAGAGPRLCLHVPCRFEL